MKHYQRILLLVSLGLLPLTFTETAWSQASPGASSTASSSPKFYPPGVPQGYVSAPGGWTHPSCLHHIPDGADVEALDDGSWDIVQNGQIIDHYEACSYSDIPASGFTAVGPASYGGWVEDTYQYAPSSYTFDVLGSYGVVPAAPTQDGATLYYFPGLVSTITGNCGILQPVLQWGVSPAGGGNYWALADWWWSNPNKGYSSLLKVNPGDTLALTMDSNGSTWYVTAFDETTNQSVSKTFNVGSCQFNLAYPAVLEVDTGFPVTNCNQFAHNVLNFYDIFLTATNGQQQTYSPTNQYPIGSTLSCGFGIGSSYSDVPSGSYASSTLWSTSMWSTGAAQSISSQQSGCGVLNVGDAIVQGDYLQSCNGNYTLWSQTDGNLVLYGPGGEVLWATGTNYNPGGAALVMQTDGNLVLYNKNDQAFENVGAYGPAETSPYTSAGQLPSNTSGQPGNYALMQDDGNLVVYNTSGAPVWATNTCCQ